MTSIAKTVRLSDIHPDVMINSRVNGQYDDTEIQQLATNIEHVGLILPLSVRPLPDGKYGIIDGHRRHAALCRIAENAGGTHDDMHIPVLVRDADNADARTLSLAANIMRLPLHPADQYEAFKALRNEGLEVEDIAARFALTRKEVEQRLALGSVIPEALALYREGRLNLDDMKVLANAHEDRQRAALAATEKTGRWMLSQFIKGEAVAPNDPIRKLVSEEEYVKAGGRIERDLFSERDVEMWADVEIATKLATAKMETVKQELLAAGWAWVKHEAEMTGDWLSWKRMLSELDYATPEDAERDAAIDKRIEEMDAEWQDAEEVPDEVSDDYHELQTESAEITDRMIPRYTAEQMAQGGCIIRNDFRVSAGIVTPGTKAGKVEQPETKEDKPKSFGEESWPQALVDELEAIATNEAQYTLINEAEIADCLLLATMYQDCIAGQVSKRWLAHNSADRFSHTEHNGAAAAISQHLKALGLKGGETWSLVKQIKAMTAEQRTYMRSLLVARSLKKLSNRDAKELFAVTEKQNLDGSWKPEKAFFERLNRGQLSEIHKEITGHGLAGTGKKADDVNMVATKAAAAGWVPKWMRCMLAPGRVVQDAKPKKQKRKAA